MNLGQVKPRLGPESEIYPKVPPLFIELRGAILVTVRHLSHLGLKQLLCQPNAKAHGIAGCYGFACTCRQIFLAHSAPTSLPVFPSLRVGVFAVTDCVAPSPRKKHFVPFRFFRETKSTHGTGRAPVEVGTAWF